MNACSFLQEKFSTIKSSISPMDDDQEGRYNNTRPLSAIADAFEDLSKIIKRNDDGSTDDSQHLKLSTLCEACSLVSYLFNCLGIAFKFAELEYVAKVSYLLEASKTRNNMQDIIDVDVANDTVKTPGSLSRHLRRVRQGLDLIRELFSQFLSAEDFTLKDAASMAYAQVCAPYHTWAVRTAVSAGMYALPSRDQLLQKLNETEQSAEKKMRRYINASQPVIEYIDKLYVSRNISLDW